MKFSVFPTYPIATVFLIRKVRYLLLISNEPWVYYCVPNHIINIICKCIHTPLEDVLSIHTS